MTDSENLQRIADNSDTLIWLCTAAVFVLGTLFGQMTWRIVYFALRTKSFYVFVAFSLLQADAWAVCENQAWPGNGGTTWLQLNVNGAIVDFTYQGNNAWTGSTDGTAPQQAWTMSVVDDGTGMVSVHIHPEDFAGSFQVDVDFWGTFGEPINLADVFTGNGIAVLCMDSGIDASGNCIGSPCWGGGAGPCTLPMGWPASITFHYADTSGQSPLHKYELNWGSGDDGNGDTVCGWFPGSCDNKFKLVPGGPGGGTWVLKGPNALYCQLGPVTSDPTEESWAVAGFVIDCKGSEADLDCDGTADADDPDMDGDGVDNETDCALCDGSKSADCPESLPACACCQLGTGDGGVAGFNNDCPSVCPQLLYCEFKLCRLDTADPPAATSDCITFDWASSGGGYVDSAGSGKASIGIDQADFPSCLKWKVTLPDGETFNLDNYPLDPANATNWEANGWKVTEKLTDCTSSGHCCGCCCDECQASGGGGGGGVIGPTGPLGLDPGSEQVKVKDQLATGFKQFDLGGSSLEKTYINQTFSFAMPDGTYHDFAFSMTPDTGTPVGNAVESMRLGFRAICTFALSLYFFRMVWRSVAQVV